MFNYTNEDGSPKIAKMIGQGIVVILALVVLFDTFGTIGAGEKGVLLRFGAVTGKTNDAGLYFKAPFIESMVLMNVQTQIEKVDAQSASKDLQDVSTQVGLNYNVVASDVGKLYQEIGEDYKGKIIDPAIQDAVKATTANYTAEELITKREIVREEIVQTLKGKFQGKHLNVIDVNITNFKFSDSFNQAIEAKVTAEQNALAAKNKLDQVKYEADQRIAQAEGEAKAISIQAQAITQQGGAEYVNLKSVEKWNGVLPTYMMSGGAVPFINLK